MGAVCDMYMTLQGSTYSTISRDETHVANISICNLQSADTMLLTMLTCCIWSGCHRYMPCHRQADNSLALSVLPVPRVLVVLA